MISNDITNFLSQANSNQIPTIALTSNQSNQSSTRDESQSKSSQDLSEAKSNQPILMADRAFTSAPT